MFCLEGNMPLSVFKHKWEEEFNTVYDKLDIPDEIYVGKKTSVPMFDFEETKRLAFNTFLTGCNSIVATSPERRTISIDANQFLLDSDSIFLHENWFVSEEFKRAQLGPSMVTYLFVDDYSFCVSLSVWKHIFVPIVNEIKKNETKYLWAIEFEDMVRNIKPFEGWSLSISIDEAKGALNKVAEYSEFYVDEVVKPGRPNTKYKRVVEVLQKNYPNGLSGKTKKEIMREHKFDNISEKTVERAIKDINNHFILGQNNGQN